MLYKRLAGAVVALAIAGLGALLLASPAHATTNEVVVDYDSQPCVEVAITSAWATDTHLVDNAYLVVKVDGETQAALVGDTITVGPFERPTEVQWRVFGGGERDYDDPAWPVDKGAINTYGEVHGWDWTVGGDVPEWVSWHSFWVDGCVTPPAPSEPESTCDVFTDVTLPEHEGVLYAQSEWSVVTPGTYQTAVTASPEDGFAFADGATAQWSFEVTLPTCPGPQGPPGPEGPAGPPTSPSPEVSESPAPGIAGGMDDAGGQLPVTGSPLPWIALGGVALIVTGSGLYAVSRARRRPTFTA